MHLSSDLMRLLLLGCMLSMAVLAMLTLHQRSITLQETIIWCLTANLIPALGPFKVIWAKSGNKQTQI